MDIQYLLTDPVCKHSKSRPVDRAKLIKMRMICLVQIVLNIKNNRVDDWLETGLFKKIITYEIFDVYFSFHISNQEFS
ncbi:hypothetical protein B9Z51_09610 [Limnohabitans sp. T6-5]|nr:hypothetical protein B9Z51_09610 [Limnohabitans sp. T6-5]